MKSYILKLSKLLELKKISQLELSQLIGKNKNTVSNYFTDKTKIDIETLGDIASALGVPLNYFFTEVDEPGKKIIKNGNNNQIAIGNNNSNDNAELEICKKELDALKRESALKDKIIEMLEKDKQ